MARTTLTMLAMVALGTLAGCDDGGKAGDTGPGATTTTTPCTATTCDTGPTTTPIGLDDNFGVEETEGIEGCDNLLPSCAYPFPTGALVADGHLAIPAEALPETNSNLDPMDPGPLNEFSAFGASSPILFQYPGAVQPEWPVFDPTPGFATDSPVVVVDAATGERLPFWLEPDFLTPDLDDPLMVIRPSAPWPRGTEIVVGLRGFTDAAGAPADALEAFVPLRDQTASMHHGIHDRRDHYESVVFPALEAAGVDRSELQLAWSFPTRSDAEATAKLTAVRDTIFAAFPAGGPEVQIDDVLACGGIAPPDGCHPDLRYIIDGTIFVPSVVLPGDELGVRLIRTDDDGNPVVDGTEAWPFRLQLPNSAYTGAEPIPVLQYGHGFLGSYNEANNSWLRELGERQGMAILATSMQGMNESDFFVWLNVLANDGGRFPHLADLSMQGVVNQLAQQRMMSTSLAAAWPKELLRDDGELPWDTDTIWYHGNSQGGSVGTLVMATSLDVQRGDLGVPGSGYPFLLHRSTVFTDYTLVLEGSYDGDDAVSRFLSLLGTGWDDVDPLTFAPHITDPLPGTPAHEVLLHVAKEDQQVHNEASFILGRATGAVLATPAVRPVWGLEEVAYPFTAEAALIEVDFMIPDDPTPLDPPDGDPSEPNDGDTHGWLRKWAPAQDQMVHFFRTGEFIDVCGGQACVTSDRP
mgnify:FL=1